MLSQGIFFPFYNIVWKHRLLASGSLSRKQQNKQQPKKKPTTIKHITVSSIHQHTHMNALMLIFLIYLIRPFCHSILPSEDEARARVCGLVIQVL